MRTYKVGLLYFREEFGRKLLHSLNQLEPIRDIHGKPVKIQAEHLEVHEWDLDTVLEHDFILDRASHYFKLGIPQFMMRSFLGTHIVNNPLSFQWFIERKDVGYYMAHHVGVKIPPTFILPVCDTPFFKKEDFAYHRLFEWERMIETVGFPCIMKPANGRGARGVYQCSNRRELMEAYSLSGSEIMTIQAKVHSPYPWQLRCLCIGRNIRIIKYIFREGDRSEYLPDQDFLPPHVEKQVREACMVLNRIFGYEMNSVEFFLDSNDIPWAIDFNNPIPDGRLEALGQQWHDIYLQDMLQLVIEKAQNPEAADFLPNLNEYAKIARMPLSPQEKFAHALALSKGYYEKTC